MMIRTLKLEDINKIKEIHEEFYKDEFELPDFLSNYLSAFVVVNDNDDIISAAGVRNIAEIVLVTDKSMSVRDRRDALICVTQASAFMAKRSNHEQLHAFIQDRVWLGQLKRFGFRECKGTAVVLNL